MDCPIPAASTVAAAKTIVNKKAKDIIPFTEFSHSGGEGIRFDPQKITKFLLDAYNLSGKAKVVNLQMPITYDGAQLTHKTSHVTMGLKIADLDAVHPKTKLPFRHMSEMNSPENSHPLCMVVGKESKEMIRDNFKWLLDFFSASSLGSEGGIGNPFADLGYLPFDMCVPADMKEHWNLCLPGGTAKIKIFKTVSPNTNFV